MMKNCYSNTRFNDEMITVDIDDPVTTWENKEIHL